MHLADDACEKQYGGKCPAGSEILEDLPPNEEGIGRPLVRVHARYQDGPAAGSEGVRQTHIAASVLVGVIAWKPRNGLEFTV